MSIKVIKPNKCETGYVHSEYEEFLMDSVKDIAILPKDVAPNSIAYPADMSVTYRLSPNKEWKEVVSQGSSGGSGGGAGGGVAFIAMNRPAPVVWDASSNQYVELTKDRFIELFNSGAIRVMDADLGDPTKHPPGTGTAQGTVVSYWINDTVATISVAGVGTNGYYSGNVPGWV